MTSTDTAARHTREYNIHGVRVYIIGTAHISAHSVRDVEALVRRIRPNGVFLELCRSRASILTMPATSGALQVPPLTVQAIQDAHRVGGMPHVLQLVLSNFMMEAAKKIGSEVVPGSEFATAARVSKEYGAMICLGDRDVSVTLKRAWAALSFFERVRFLWSLLTESLDDLTAEELEKLKENDMLTTMIKEVAEEFPNLLEPLLNERDRYMSYTLRHFCDVLRQRASNPHIPLTVVAVIGMGHMNGLERALSQEMDEADFQVISKVPPQKSWTTVLVQYVVVPCAITTAAYFMLKRLRPSLRLTSV